MEEYKGVVCPQNIGETLTVNFRYYDDALKKHEKDLESYAAAGWSKISKYKIDNVSYKYNKDTGKFGVITRMDIKVTFQCDLTQEELDEYFEHLEEVNEAEEYVRMLKPITWKPWIALIIGFGVGLLMFLVMAGASLIGPMFSGLYSDSSGNAITPSLIDPMLGIGVGAASFGICGGIGLLIFIIISSVRKGKINHIYDLYGEKDFDLKEELEGWKDKIKELRDARNGYLGRFSSTGRYCYYSDNSFSYGGKVIETGLMEWLEKEAKSHSR